MTSCSKVGVLYHGLPKFQIYHLCRNVIAHLVTGWLAAWSLVSLGTWMFPFFVHVLLIITRLLICIAQDVKLGVSVD